MNMPGLIWISMFDVYRGPRSRGQVESGSLDSVRSVCHVWVSIRS